MAISNQSQQRHYDYLINKKNTKGLSPLEEAYLEKYDRKDTETKTTPPKEIPQSLRIGELLTADPRGETEARVISGGAAIPSTPQQMQAIARNPYDIQKGIVSTPYSDLIQEGTTISTPEEIQPSIPEVTNEELGYGPIEGTEPPPKTYAEYRARMMRGAGDRAKALTTGLVSLPGQLGDLAVSAVQPKKGQITAGPEAYIAEKLKSLLPDWIFPEDPGERADFDLEGKTKELLPQDYQQAAKENPTAELAGELLGTLPLIKGLQTTTKVHAGNINKTIDKINDVLDTNPQLVKRANQWTNVGIKDEAIEGLNQWRKLNVGTKDRVETLNSLIASQKGGAKGLGKDINELSQEIVNRVGQELQLVRQLSGQTGLKAWVRSPQALAATSLSAPAETYLKMDTKKLQKGGWLDDTGFLTKKSKIAAGITAGAVTAAVATPLLIKFGPAALTALKGMSAKGWASLASAKSTATAKASATLSKAQTALINTVNKIPIKQVKVSKEALQEGLKFGDDLAKTTYRTIGKGPTIEAGDANMLKGFINDLGLKTKYQVSKGKYLTEQISKGNLGYFPGGADNLNLIGKLKDASSVFGKGGDIANNSVKDWISRSSIWSAGRATATDYFKFGKLVKDGNIVKNTVFSPDTKETYNQVHKLVKGVVHSTCGCPDFQTHRSFKGKKPYQWCKHLINFWADQKGA